MKTLILSCNTGQGHNSAGRALLEEFTRRGLPCEMKDALAYGRPRTSELVSEGYVRMTQYAPAVFGGMYRAGEFLSNPRRKSPVYLANIRYAEKLAEDITHNGYDTVLCPHLFPAEALTFLRRRRGLEARFYGVATDYTCSPFWEETDIDRFFIPHEGLRAEYEGKGFTPGRLVVTGIPVASAFRQKTPTAEARAALGLPADGPAYLVMTGSMGFGDVAEIVAALLDRSGTEACVGVMIGRNAALDTLLAARFGENARVRRIPFTRRVPLYMDACDVLLSKPGGLSSTEAAVKNVPLVHTAPIPGCETANARFFAARGLSVATATPEESAAAAVRLAGDRKARERQLAAQRATVNPSAAEDICGWLLARAERRG